MLAVLYVDCQVCWSLRDVKSKHYCRTEEPHSRTIYFIPNILYCIFNHAVEWAFKRLCLLENHLRCTLSFYSNGSLQNQQKQESLEKSLHVTTLYELWWWNLWSERFVTIPLFPIFICWDSIFHCLLSWYMVHKSTSGRKSRECLNFWHREY